MRQNDIYGAEAGKAFADMLAQNTVLKELDLSSQKYETSSTYGNALDAAYFAKELSVGISGNGALHCVDGTRYQSKKSFMRSTNVCCHCGLNKTQHTSR